MADRKQAKREEYEYYKKLGVCFRCRSADARQGHVYCFDCTEKIRIKDNLRYANMTPEEKEEYLKKTQIKKKELRNKRIANGLCTKCGKKPPSENKRLCLECSVKQRRADKKHSKKRNKCSVPIDLRNACGLCKYCGEPLAEETDKLCAKCHKKRVESSKQTHVNPTPALLNSYEDFKKRGREFNNGLFLAPKMQKQADRAAIENFKRMCAI